MTTNLYGIYERNFNKLLKLAPCLNSLTVGETHKSQSKSFMDLHLEVLSENDRFIYISLAHYYEMNGDLVSDPCMTLRLLKGHPFIEVYDFQDFFGYQTVYSEDEKFVYPKRKKNLNAFLGTWLKNCLQQGHKLSRPMR